MFYNHHRFFITDKTTRKRFFKSADQGTADEGLSGSSTQDETGVKGPQFNELQRREFRFMAPPSPEKILENLLTEVLKGGNVGRVLDKILELLRQNRRLAQKVFEFSNHGRLNTLEVVLNARNMNIAAQLYHLGATVQAGHEKIYLAQLAKLDPKRFAPSPEFLPKQSFIPRLVR